MFVFWGFTFVPLLLYLIKGLVGSSGGGSFLPSPPLWVICRYILLQEFELADHGKLFCTSVGGIDDAEDEHYEEHEVNETEKGSH